MKKLIAVLLAVVLVMAFACGCTNSAISEPIRIATLKGPTGMGMVVMMDKDESSKYNIMLASAPDDVTAKFISGEIDIAAVPINLAAVLYNKMEGNVVMIAVNTLGVLYILENGNTVNSISDLAGKTLYATGQGSTPEYILNYLLEKNGIADQVKIEYKAEHSELATLMASGDVTLGMLPEPNATTVLTKNQSVRRALNLTKQWEKVCDTQLVQGCIIARRDYLDAHKDAVDQFLKDYEASESFVNRSHTKAAELIAGYGIIENAEIAKESISKSNIVCMRGSEMKTAASGMLKVLFNANPKSVGGALPGDDFYME